MTDKEKLLVLLQEFGVTPIVETFEYPKGIFSQYVSLSALDGNVKGYSGFTCDFIFDLQGKFVSVGVWE